MPKEHDEFSYYRFRDLFERGIVNSHPELCRLVRQRGFPPPVKMGDAMQSGALYPRREVHEWLRALEAKRQNQTAAE